MLWPQLRGGARTHGGRQLHLDALGNSRQYTFIMNLLGATTDWKKKTIRNLASLLHCSSGLYQHLRVGYNVCLAQPAQLHLHTQETSMTASTPQQNQI